MNTFNSIYSHGFVRTAVCVPKVNVADITFNTAQILALAKEANNLKVALALFPELGVTAYTLDDLFLQSVILESAKNAISVIVSESKNINTILVIGSPLKFDDKIFNCALVIYKEKLWGLYQKVIFLITENSMKKDILQVHTMLHLRKLIFLETISLLEIN